MFQVGRVGMKRNKVIGLTGGISSGKSLVTAYLEEKGYPVIDSDKIVRDLQESPQLLKKIGDLFPGLVDQGVLQREKLGRLVFSDEKERKKLDDLMHPLVFSVIEKEIQDRQGLVFVDMPLLLETLDRQKNISYDEIWLVWLPKDKQIQRLMKRDSINQAYARQKIDAQMSLEAKKVHADVLIDNSQDPKTTLKQVDRELKRLCDEAF